MSSKLTSNPNEMNRVYSPENEDVFVDHKTGWAYLVKKNGEICVDYYLMDFNMYEQNCWLCTKQIENPKHCKRCFFCKKCCILKQHPNPYIT